MIYVTKAKIMVTIGWQNKASNMPLSIFHGVLTAKPIISLTQWLAVNFCYQTDAPNCTKGALIPLVYQNRCYQGLPSDLRAEVAILSHSRS